MREEVEALEDDADLGALPRDALLRVLDELAVALAVADQVAVHLDPAGVDLLEVVDAAQEGRLPGAGRADHADDLAAAHLEVDALQHLEPAEALVDVGRADDRVGGTPTVGTSALRAPMPARRPRLRQPLPEGELLAALADREPALDLRLDERPDASSAARYQIATAPKNSTGWNVVE